MANTIKVLFWLRRNKMNDDGLVPLMLRLSYQKERLDKASGYYINPLHWSATTQRLKATKDSLSTASLVNNWMVLKLSKVSDICDGLHKKNEPIYLPKIMDALFAKAEEQPTILKVFTAHNKDLKLRVGKDYTHSTYEKYEFTFDKVKAFIETKLKKKDILLRDLNVKFIMDFDFYMRVNDNNQHNTAVKYCLNLKRVMNVAVLQNLLILNPFLSYKTVYKNTPQVYLDEAAVLLLEKIELKKDSYLLVRDLFIFQCYTGLAYTDMTSLTVSEIRTDHNQKQWIIKSRQKTGITCTIPLLPKALSILNKYTPVKSSDTIFAHYSIQKYNQYIGEIGFLAGLSVKLSSHVGRRTFGNIGLAKGLSLNVISKILGHSNTIITQKIYAITTQNIISNEIDKWI